MSDFNVPGSRPKKNTMKFRKSTAPHCVAPYSFSSSDLISPHIASWRHIQPDYKAQYHTTASLAWDCFGQRANSLTTSRNLYSLPECEGLKPQNRGLSWPKHALQRFKAPRGWAHPPGSKSRTPTVVRPSLSSVKSITSYTILYYTILYYTILYYTILYYTILYYTILYYDIIYYNMIQGGATWSPFAPPSW